MSLRWPPAEQDIEEPLAPSRGIVVAVALMGVLAFITAGVLTHVSTAQLLWGAGLGAYTGIVVGWLGWQLKTGELGGGE